MVVSRAREWFNMLETLTSFSRFPFLAKLNNSLIQSGVSPCPLTPVLMFLIFFLLLCLLSPASFMVLLRYPVLLRPLEKSSKFPLCLLPVLVGVISDLCLELLEFWRMEDMEDVPDIPVL